MLLVVEDLVGQITLGQECLPGAVGLDILGGDTPSALARISRKWARRVTTRSPAS